MLRGKPTQFCGEIVEEGRSISVYQFARHGEPASRRPAAEYRLPPEQAILIEDTNYIKWQDLLVDANSVGKSQ